MIRNLFFGLVLFSLLAPFSTGFSQTHTFVARVVKILVVVDQRFIQAFANAPQDTQPRWESVARKIVEVSSQILQQEVGIQLQVVGLKEWKQAGNVESLKDWLPKSFTSQNLNQMGADLVLALSSGISRSNQKGRVTLGESTFFERYISIQIPMYKLEETPDILIHELGHTFGAVHNHEDPMSFMCSGLTNGKACPDEKTLFSAEKSKKYFEEQNKNIILYTRDHFDFQKGVRNFSEEISQDFQELYSKLDRDHDQIFPLAFAFTNEGRKLCEAKQFDEGVEELKRALALDSSEWLILFYLGDCYTKAGDYKAAETYYRRISGLNPNNKEKTENFLHNLSFEMMDKGKKLCIEKKFSQGIELLKKAQGLEPREGQFLYHIGRCFEDAGNKLAAQKYYRSFEQFNFQSQKQVSEK